MISALYLHSTSCPMETSSVQIEQDEEVLYFGESVFFSYLLYWRLHWCFLGVADLQGLDLCLAGGDAFDCGRYYSIIA